MFTVLAQMGAAAAIIVRSGKMRHLFEGGYHSRYVYVHISVCTG